MLLVAGKSTFSSDIVPKNVGCLGSAGNSYTMLGVKK